MFEAIYQLRRGVGYFAAQDMYVKDIVRFEVRKQNNNLKSWSIGKSVWAFLPEDNYM
jgi:hypothetical protein